MLWMEVILIKLINIYKLSPCKSQVLDVYRWIEFIEFQAYLQNPNQFHSLLIICPSFDNQGDGNWREPF